MMKILAFAEQREGKFRKSAFEVTRAARVLADKLGGEVIGAVIGHNVEYIAPGLGGFGASRVLVDDDPRLQFYSGTAYANIFAELVRKEQPTVILAAATSMGKDLTPRLAVKIDAGLAADCIALRVEGGEIIATRPVYAGKALVEVKVNSAVRIFTLRPNVFTAGSASPDRAAVEKVDVQLRDEDFSSHVKELHMGVGRPDVTEAGIVVSGGRGLKGPENFHLVEELADALHAGVGASRAVVDAGWRPHDEQVGQTGKTVSPTVYIACGISGAVQHLAGMSSSKCIVAINKDKDAPIFQVADYGVVGDVLEVLPAVTREIKLLLGKD
jgi:electron transfer flavoprotein alpha subunit